MTELHQERILSQIKILTKSERHYGILKSIQKSRLCFEFLLLLKWLFYFLPGLGFSSRRN